MELRCRLLLQTTHLGPCPGPSQTILPHSRLTQHSPAHFRKVGPLGSLSLGLWEREVWAPGPARDDRAAVAHPDDHTHPLWPHERSRREKTTLLYSLLPRAAPGVAFVAGRVVLHPGSGMRKGVHERFSSYPTELHGAERKPSPASVG